MAGNDRDGAFVPGLYSNTARQTEFGISLLRAHCEFDNDTTMEETPRVKVKKPKVSRNQQEKSSTRLTKTIGQHRVEKAMRAKAKEAEAQARQSGSGGDLARAIQEKLGQKIAASQPQEPPPTSPKTPKLGRSETSSFLSSGIYDGPWASKFTASKSPGALNRWKSDQRPDPAWYKVQYNMVHDRQRVPDFGAGPPLAIKDGPTSPKAPGGPAPPTGTFSLTGIDVEKIEDEWREGGFHRSQTEGYLAKTPNWDQYNSMRVGRYPQLQFNRITEPAKGMYQQDLKGYPKQRPPAWDFTKTLGRQTLADDDVAAPGKYDVNYSAVRGKIPSVSMERALPRELADGLLGHFALQAVLHPDAKKFPGGVGFDTSTAKDFLRRRITHVNDFDREMSRPDPTPAAIEYHDTSDPHACESTLRWQLNYNADVADLCVAHRRDMAPKYEHMIARGKTAVQGLRALQSDLGVRGSVGLGFVETTGQRTLPVERLEGRNCNAAHGRDDLGPRFDHHTTFEALCLETNVQGVYPVVHGEGKSYESKPPPLKKPKGTAFQRQAAKGFTKGVKGIADASHGRGAGVRSLPQLGPPLARRSPPPPEEGLEDWSKLLTSLEKSEPELLR